MENNKKTRMFRNMKTRSWLRFVGAIVPACALSASLSVPLATPVLAQAGRDAVKFAPHRAVYDISLDRASPGSGVTDMTGRMVYELTGNVCEGYTQNMRFVTRMSGQEGDAQISDLRTSSWEEAAGGRMRFDLKQYRNDELEEETKGQADREGSGGPVDVRLRAPTNKGLKIDGNALFPMQHSQELIRAARRGTRVFTVPLYDGSEKGEKVYLTTSFIGDRLEDGQAGVPQKLAEAGGLAALPSWPVSISYFEPSGQKVDAVPSYELSFRFFDNGISTRLHIDYGDFAIRGELAGLTMLPATKCEAEK